MKNRVSRPGIALALAVLAGGWIQNAHAQAVGGAISGERVGVTEREAPKALPTETAKTSAPFGSNLFTGRFKAEREDGFNPAYVVQPGDRIQLRIWGATKFEATAVVDAQGNIFIPQVGPVRVVGVENGKLTGFIKQAIARVFTRNVEVYTNVASTTPVITYIAGYVKNPGSYAGIASDSLLYFMDRAGGVNPENGSYRDIRVLRGGRIIARADLYRFLLDGLIPKIQFQDGDTIVVGPRGDTVTVQGAARNRHAFELSPPYPASSAPRVTGITGADAIALARPHADASHAALSGSRAEGPVSAYLSLADFAKIELRDGDQIVFEADKREDTMLIRVEGSHLGPSRFAVPRGATLHQLLDYIAVDQKLSDISSISLRRQSIKELQRKRLEDTLRRLEAATLSATSQTDTESKIRTDEAKLIASFVERARKVQPDGVLVVAVNGEIRDVLLQPEDVITVPQRNQVVMLSGEVGVPQAVVYERGADVDDYVARVGGYTNRADEDQILIVRKSGEVLRDKHAAIKPGDEILVLPEVPVKNLQIAKTIIQSIFQIAVSAGVLVGL